MTNKKLNSSGIAIRVKNVKKQFSIPHEKITSLRGAFVNIFRKNTYESFYALKDVSFEVKKGEFFGILGRNGSGKSTLLKILAGVYKKDGGEIEISGRISPFLELGIGFNPELSGRDNIYLNATVLGLKEKEIDEKFDSIVAFSELERFIDQKIKNYSSGMMVRLAFAVSIHANRDILLMDEVLAVGDANFQTKCLREFARYKEMGKTVILVTHDIGTVQRYCDRAMLLRNGEVAMMGTAEEVGNEYIYQNMSDEEKRIKKEQERAAIQVEKMLIEEKKKQEVERIRAEKEVERLRGRVKDEEIKRIKEEAVRQEEERRNKVAEITGIEFLDKDGKVRNVFMAGDDMSVRISFKIYKDKPIINLGISMYSLERVYVFSANTINDKVMVESTLGSRYIKINLKNVRLNPNSYYIRAVVVGDDFKRPYSSIQQSEQFQVFSKEKKEGIVDLPHSWEQ